jgi:hypothetical protein
VQITVTVEVADVAQWHAPEVGADLVRSMIEAAVKRITNDFAAGWAGPRRFYYGDDGVEITWPVLPAASKETSG